jgi:hypothetical protein
MRRWRFVMLGGLALAAFLVGVMLLDRASCLGKWGDSGMLVDWGPMSGCRVKSDGQWLPAEAFRKVP